jgi:hypothetical protein
MITPDLAVPGHSAAPRGPRRERPRPSRRAFRGVRRGRRGARPREGARGDRRGGPGAASRRRFGGSARRGGRARPRPPGRRAPSRRRLRPSRPQSAGGRGCPFRSHGRSRRGAVVPAADRAVRSEGAGTLPNAARRRGSRPDAGTGPPRRPRAQPRSRPFRSEAARRSRPCPPLPSGRRAAGGGRRGREAAAADPSRGPAQMGNPPPERAGKASRTSSRRARARGARSRFPAKADGPLLRPFGRVGRPPRPPRAEAEAAAPPAGPTRRPAYGDAPPVVAVRHRLEPGARRADGGARRGGGAARPAAARRAKGRRLRPLGARPPPRRGEARSSWPGRAWSPSGSARRRTRLAARGAWAGAPRPRRRPRPRPATSRGRSRWR